MLEAMKLGLEHLRSDNEEPVVNVIFLEIKLFFSNFSKTLNIISPNEIKQLLYYVLTTDSQQPIPRGVDVEQRYNSNIEC